MSKSEINNQISKKDEYNEVMKESLQILAEEEGNNYLKGQTCPWCEYEFQDENEPYYYLESYEEPVGCFCTKECAIHYLLDEEDYEENDQDLEKQE
ncbi:MAG: hypothetical protein ACTSVV_11255 [Promethearchaeota archaeon]